MGKLPVVPYEKPEPWVPSGGFSPFRTAEEQTRDAELAAETQADDDAEESDSEA
jgi:hypothetical protein